MWKNIFTLFYNKFNRVFFITNFLFFLLIYTSFNIYVFIRIFSDYNVSEFDNIYNSDIKNEIEDKYLQIVYDADKSAYWFNQVPDKLNGFFMGPKYVETSEKFKNQNISSNKFQEVSSYSPTLVSSFVALSQFSNSISLAFQTQKITQDKVFSNWTFDDRDKYNFSGLKGFLINLITNDKELKEILQKDSLLEIVELIDLEKNKKYFDLTGTFIDIFYAKEQNSTLANIFEKSTSQLEEIGNNSTSNQNDGGFGDLEKFLVAVKRILNSSKIYISDSEVIKNIENGLKKLVIKILSANEQVLNVFVASDKNNVNQIYNREGIDWLNQFQLIGIINLFLNPEEFYVSNSHKAEFLKKIEDISKTVEHIVYVIVDPTIFLAKGAFEIYSNKNQIENKKLLEDVVNDNQLFIKKKYNIILL
ncbi:hypothetical protein [Mesoplasma corruscae]|uniref:Uncharacterized protein n=1 Tax=Mesoplasma corruscae TaxID=216874 RepID=A0A2S5RGS2_9MOLU|nr:hypothetical protein [Mesoplasma corruscae]PPE06498.1 hypothetical protein MCORR_v1c01260 [Mesoplasma corruscae]